MNIVLSFVSALLDVYILKKYLDGTLKHLKESIPYYVFLIALLCSEALLLFNMKLFVNFSSNISALITSIISITTTFLLCFFYESTIKKNVYIALSFQLFVIISEMICLLISHLLPASFFSPEGSKSFVYSMNTLSKIILFIMVIISYKISSKKDDNSPLEINLLLFITPVLSCFLIVIMPKNLKVISNNKYFFEFFIVFISILNILNNYLLNKTSESYSNQILNIELNNQINYQKNKYAQLSESYKTSRRIIHDIKKHYFEIQENIKLRRYDNLAKYLDSSISDLEKTYVKYNTGNLVIDSLLTNYENISAGNNIKYTTNIEVDNNRIPLDDYDFCIILGNLLDNSLNACLNMNSDHKQINITIITSPKDKFLISVENSYSKNDTENKNPLIHGYGLNNVKNTVLHYNGIISIIKEKTYNVMISIPIKEIEKRLSPPHFN
jgi:hypothetical protein